VLLIVWGGCLGRCLDSRCSDCKNSLMKYWLNDDSKDSRLPGVGAWVICVALPVLLAATVAMALMPFGSVQGRLLSLANQISRSRSELLPILFGSQLGVSALVVAMAQFQPGHWRATPKKMGKRWLGEMRRVSSMESRYFATSFGLVGISGTIVLGVAICVLHDVSAGGVLLLLVAWGVHAVSSVVLIMVPTTGVAVIDDYWRSLARLFYIAEMWPEGLKEAKREVENGELSLGSKVKRWRIVVVLLSLLAVLIVAAFIEKYCSGAHRGIRLQFTVGCVVISATLLSIAAGYRRWKGSGIPVVVYWASLPLVLIQGLLVEVESIDITTRSSLWRNLGAAFAVIVTLFLIVLLSVAASGARFLWGRFDCLKSTLVPIWVYELKFQCRSGDNCSSGEREAIERFFVKLAKKKKKGLAEVVKESVLLPFVSR